MNQIDVNSILDQQGTTKVVNAAKAQGNAAQNVGSYLNTPSGVSWDAQGFRTALETLQGVAKANKATSVLYGLDSLHGANYVKGAVMFPQPINTGATFDPSLAKQAGVYTGRDTLAAGVQWIFGPMLEVVRHKHWPRVYESFGEDPLHVAVLGTNLVQGIQSHNVAACFKHFLGYSDPINGNDRGDIVLSDYELLNYFAPPFKTVIAEAKIMTGMGSYIKLNGVPVAGNHKTSRKLLRQDMQFQGMKVSDYGEIYLMNTQHQYAKTERDSVQLTLNQTSYDMAMVAWDTSFIGHAKALVDEGRTSIDRLRESVARIVELKMQLGLYDQNGPVYTVPGADLVSFIGDQPSQDHALRMSHESLVLLKNKANVLPLDRSQSIFLTGSSIDSISYLCGGWSINWQGAAVQGQPVLSQSRQSKAAFAMTDDVFPLGQSIRRAMQAKSPAATFFEGVDINGNIKDIQRAKQMAAQAMYTVVSLGEPPYAEMMGNDMPMDLPAGFLTYVQALASTGTKIILVLVEGRPRTLNGLAELADAVIWAGLPCEFGGPAIADVLVGDVNPSGKLPLTYPKSTTHVNLATPYYFRKGGQCVKQGVVDACPSEWDFGDGLSYTTFGYSSMDLTTAENGNVVVRVTVTNTGSMSGKESVLLFVTPSANKPVVETKLLKKFTKIELAPQQSTVVEFQVSPQDDLGYFANEIGAGFRKKLPSGTYTFFFKTDCSTKHDLCRDFVVDAPPSSCSPLEYNTDYVSNDIGKKDAPVEDCCFICRQTSGCNAFSWFQGVCYLKSKKGDVISKPGVISAALVA